MKSEKVCITGFSWSLIVLLPGMGNWGLAATLLDNGRYPSGAVQSPVVITLPNHGLAQLIGKEVHGEVQGELLALVNVRRQQAGIAPLRLNSHLSQAAQRHVEDLSRQGAISHVGSDGSTLRVRIEATGYPWSAIGENVAMGQTSPEAVMTAWMGSPGHRQNILSPEFSDLGLGYVEVRGRKYWVQVFGRSR